MSTEKIHIINHSEGVLFSFYFLLASSCVLVMFTPSASFALRVVEGAALLLAIWRWTRFGARRWAWARVISRVHGD
jgi:hypothetical protein